MQAYPMQAYTAVFGMHNTRGCKHACWTGNWHDCCHLFIVFIVVWLWRRVLLHFVSCCLMILPQSWAAHHMAFTLHSAYHLCRIGVGCMDCILVWTDFIELCILQVLVHLPYSWRLTALSESLVKPALFQTTHSMDSDVINKLTHNIRRWRARFECCRDHNTIYTQFLTTLNFREGRAYSLKCVLFQESWTVQCNFNTLISRVRG